MQIISGNVLGSDFFWDPHGQDYGLKLPVQRAREQYKNGVKHQNVLFYGWGCTAKMDRRLAHLMGGE